MADQYNPDSDPLGRFNQENARNDNQDFQDAQQNATWAQTFSDTPPADVLRARVNLADTYNRVLGNRMALAAQSDAGALGLLQKQAEYQEYQRQAPLRENLLQARAAAAGGAQRFAAQKDADTHADLGGFFDYMGNAPAVTDPGYKNYVNAGVQKFPRIIGTQAGAQALKQIYQEHDDVNSLTPPPGMQLAEVTHDENGRAKASFKPITAPVNAEDVQPKPGFVIGHYVVDSQGKSHAVMVPDPSITAQGVASQKATIEQQKLSEADNQLVNGVLSFGHLDAKGKLVPDEAGGQATHVQSFYKDPSGKRHDSPPMTIKEFQAIQAQVDAAKKAATPAVVPVAPVVPGAPIAPAGVAPVVPVAATPDIHEAANAAIAAGADPEAVKARLVKMGGDPSKLKYGK